MEIAHRTGDFAYETQGFRNAVFGFQNVKFYNGLLDFLRTENDVSETLAIIIVFGRKSMEVVNQASDFAMKTQRFRNAIFGFQNVRFYKGLLDFLRTENDDSKTLSIIWAF